MPACLCVLVSACDGVEGGGGEWRRVTGVYRSSMRGWAVPGTRGGRAWRGAGKTINGGGGGGRDEVWRSERVDGCGQPAQCAIAENARVCAPSAASRAPHARKVRASVPHQRRGATHPLPLLGTPPLTVAITKSSEAYASAAAPHEGERRCGTTRPPLLPYPCCDTRTRQTPQRRVSRCPSDILLYCLLMRAQTVGARLSTSFSSSSTSFLHTRHTHIRTYPC